jgi:hypothetical protein
VLILLGEGPTGFGGVLPVWLKLQLLQVIQHSGNEEFLISGNLAKKFSSYIGTNCTISNHLPHLLMS